MRTLIFLVCGVLLALLLLGRSRRYGQGGRLLIFLIGWLLVTVWNLVTGMSHGYSMQEELPIQLLIYLLPASVALWLFRRRRQ